jgi:hypothetical protein
MLRARKARVGTREGGRTFPVLLAVLPIAIIEIARDQEEIDFLLNGQGHQILKCPAGGSTEQLRGRTLMRLQSPERAVEVGVCGVDEAEHGY